jgi:hypothetical protein
MDESTIYDAGPVTNFGDWRREPPPYSGEDGVIMDLIKFNRPKIAYRTTLRPEITPTYETAEYTDEPAKSVYNPFPKRNVYIRDTSHVEHKEATEWYQLHSASETDPLGRTYERYKHVAPRYDEMHMQRDIHEGMDLAAERDASLDMSMTEEKRKAEYERIKVGLAKDFERADALKDFRARLLARIIESGLQINPGKVKGYFGEQSKVHKGQVYASLARSVLNDPRFMRMLSMKTELHPMELRRYLSDIEAKEDDHLTEKERLVIGFVGVMKTHIEPDLPIDQEPMEKAPPKVKAFADSYHRAMKTVFEVLGPIHEYDKPIARVLAYRKTAEGTLDKATPDSLRAEFLELQGAKTRLLDFLRKEPDLLMTTTRDFLIDKYQIDAYCLRQMVFSAKQELMMKSTQKLIVDPDDPVAKKESKFARAIFLPSMELYQKKNTIIAKGGPTEAGRFIKEKPLVGTTRERPKKTLGPLEAPDSSKHGMLHYFGETSIGGKKMNAFS